MAPYASSDAVVIVRVRGERGVRVHGRPREQHVRQFAANDAVLRLVAIAEDFVSTLLIELTERRLSPVQPLTQALWQAEIGRVDTTWERRVSAWTRLHGVDMKRDFSCFAELEGFIAARNAITHGLGELTRRQLADRANHARHLAAAGIALENRRVIIGAANVDSCADVARALIRWLDDAAQQVADG